VLDLKALDLSVLDSLKELKSEREAIESRLQKMEERKHEVAPPIYLRVRSDYESQKQELLAQETPLRHRASQIYADVRKHLDGVEKRFDDAQLELQEIEFRNSLGEYEEVQFNERKNAVKASLESQDFAKAEAETMRARFIDAFGSEAALELATPTGLNTVHATELPPSPVVAKAAMPAPPPIPFDELPPLPNKPMSMAPVAIAPAPPTPVPPTSVSPPASPTPPLPAAASPPKRGNPDATMMFRPGKLVPANPEAGAQTATLSLKPVSIGTDASCDIRVQGLDVLTKHVEISLSRTGFVAKALGPAVLLINGVQTVDQLLKDGDALQVGAARFTFKSA
jgi:hypothetical protein